MLAAPESPSATPPSAAASPAVSMEPLPRIARGWRVFYFYSGAVLLTGVVSMLFADLLWRTGWSALNTILLALFVVLFLLAAVGCTHAIVGFALRRLGEKRRITLMGEYTSRSIAGTSTAIVYPVYNEEVSRVYERLRATYESLQKTGELERFDFFILSDSTDPDKWVEEERRWLDLIRDLDALGRIYYRRRVNNEGKKSGNIRDFLNTWGRRYRYFLVCDADSVMRGETLVDLVKMMEVHPTVGLIQTMPALVNAESLFGRIQQFSNRLYAPIFIAGLNFWTEGFGNYWGHNAIIRTEPFMQWCDLPHLPGVKPFGGQILSHDFVEAALLLKANWQVWFAYDLEGSYEEAPQAMLDNAQRDRRWCQGNLQHAVVLFARGLRGISRIHLLLGIFGYLASPLWLLFLLTFNFTLWLKLRTGLTEIIARGRTPFLELTGTAHAFLVFVICMAVLFLPKVLALIDLAMSPTRRQAFGGVRKAAISALFETIFSTFHAPLQMLWHSKFVVTILLGMGVQWGSQKRRADGIAWSTAIRGHWQHLLIGLVWGAIIWRIDPITFWWFAPVMAGMVISIPLSVWTSRRSWGARTRDLGWFVTPEEIAAPEELASLESRMQLLEKAGETAQLPADSGVTAAVLDPYVNSLHVSLLREKRLNPEYREALAQLGVGKPEVRNLAEKLLLEGPAALKRAEKMLVLSDAETMSWAHRQAWLRPGDSLAPCWQTAIRQYAR